MQTIITTILNSLTGLFIGYFIKTIKDYKKRYDVQNIAIRNQLKSNLVNQYYVYAEIGKVPKYVAEAWYSMFESYTELGGNSFIKNDIEPKFAQLKVDD